MQQWEQDRTTNSMDEFCVPSLHNDNTIDDEGPDQLWGGNDDTLSESSPKVERLTADLCYNVDSSTR